jgi:hypothetical protein
MRQPEPAAQQRRCERRGVLSRCPKKRPDKPAVFVSVGAAGYFAAAGIGSGFSDSELRYAITSARSLSREMPAKPIAVPGA